MITRNSKFPYCIVTAPDTGKYANVLLSMVGYTKIDILKTIIDWYED
jgi:hypothetical protein